MNNIPGIDFSSFSKNQFMDSEYSLYKLPFKKNNEYFSNFDNFVYFVKACERMVRVSDDYTNYKKQLYEIGLNFCQVMPNITIDDATIEMHHGPILTLFDIIAIMIDSELEHGRNVTTFSISDKCLDEHYNNNIQIIMLCETVHQEVHENNIFLNMKMAHGNLNKFIDSYYAGLRNEHIFMINNYIETSLNNDSTDNNILKLQNTIKRWGSM